MLLLGESSGGSNIIGEAKARPPYYPAPTVAPAWVEVYYRKLDANGLPTTALIKHGDKFAPTANVLLPDSARDASRIEIYTVSFNASGVPNVRDPLHGAKLVVDLEATSMTPVLAADEHVPTVTLPPMVTKAGYADEWILFVPDPDAHGATLTNCEVKVQKADDESVFTVWPFLASPQHRIEQTGYPAMISYRLRNQSAEDAGNGRGWSVWSPEATAAEAGATSPPPPAAGSVGAFVAEYDINDSRAPTQAEVVMA